MPKQELLQKNLNKIATLDSVSLAEYKQSVIKYSVQGEFKSKILDACDERLAELDRSCAMVEHTDMSDFGGH